MSESGLHPNLISYFASDRSDIRENPLALPSHQLLTWQSIPARRFDFCARMDVPQACLPLASRRLPRPLCPRKHSSAFLPRRCAPPRVSPRSRVPPLDRWPPVAHRVAHRAVLAQPRESWRRSWGGYSPSVTGIVRKRSRAHDLLRPHINSGEGANLSPLRIHLFLLPPSSPVHRAPCRRPLRARRCRHRMLTAHRRRRHAVSRPSPPYAAAPR